MSRVTTEHVDGRAEISGLAESARHELLANERCRLALEVFSEQTTSIGLEELATKIAMQSEGLDPDDEEAVAQLKITLHHAHLPKMGDLGVIDYDTASGQIIL